jgi:hypothetical protein
MAWTEMHGIAGNRKIWLESKLLPALERFGTLDRGLPDRVKKPNEAADRGTEPMTEEERVFSGGVAVITGAAAGIGMGLARRCGEIGMTVVVTDINGAGAESVAADIVAQGGKAEAT